MHSNIRVDASLVSGGFIGGKRVMHRYENLMHSELNGLIASIKADA